MTMTADPVADWLQSATAVPAGWRRHELLRSTFTDDVVDALRDLDDPDLNESVAALWNHEYFAFRPRPNSVVDGDQQEAFVDSEAFISVAIGGNGCLAPEQPVLNAESGCYESVGSIRGPWSVWSRSPESGQLSKVRVGAPWVKGVAPIFRWTFSDGSALLATEEHRVLSATGEWVKLRTALDRRTGVAHDVSLSQPSRQQHGRLPPMQGLGHAGTAQDPSVLASAVLSSWQTLRATMKGPVRSVHASSGQHYQRRGSSWRLRCFSCFRQCGERLRQGQGIGQGAPPLQACVLGRSRLMSRAGGSDVESECSRLDQRIDHLPNSHFASLLRQLVVSSIRPVWLPCAPVSGTRRMAADQQSPALSDLHLRTTPSSLDEAREAAFAWSHPSAFPSSGGALKVISCEFVRTGPYYDITVPPWANYVSGGLTHANSGKTYIGAQKTVQFLERNAPRKRDWPFWIVTTTYELAGESLWKQKLREIIPAAWIDWDRITWHDTRRGWPASVPLKPDASGNNWALQFKSYEQGRENMQAVALGGCWFSEQFPFEILEEVVRGIREHAAPGCIWCEFTPIDPSKSIEIEEKYEAWVQGAPEAAGWAFFHLNTEKAMQAGHADETWYHGFFGMVSEEMMETRKRGHFASYEGQIYKYFNPQIHLVEHITVPFGNVVHKRGLDWGAGEENAFCVLWGCKDSMGVWWIYDEYYTTSPLLFREHAEEINNLQPWDDKLPQYRETYADPSRPDGMRELQSAGIRIVGALNEVYSGIESVQSALRVHPIVGPRLYIDRVRCPNLARQMKTYRWERSTMKGVNPKDAKPQPLKKDDHAVDALRYLIHTDAKRSGGGIEAAKQATPARPQNRGLIPSRRRKR